ncbi:hypothetical protein ACLBYG_22150 [Methylobacterium sp. D53M]
MMRVATIAGALLTLAVAPAGAQTAEKPRTLGSIMVDNPTKKRDILIGMAEALSTKYPTLRLSMLTKCLEDAADMPVNWSKDLRPFVLACASKASAQ